jgi:type IV pilus assembly protein PilV
MMNLHTHPQHSARSARRAHTRQRGASMIELLVSVLIFAFGMLGLVGLQNRTLGFGQMSLYRSQAAALSDDILDRMRADRALAKAGNWDTTFATNHTTYSGTTVAQLDLREWKAQVETLLPSGVAQIERDGSKVTITIRWNERDSAANTEFKTVSAL